MENGCSYERKTITNELLQGMELAKQLRVHLGTNASSVETKDLLIQRIVTSYEKAIHILKWSGSMGSTPGVPESPLSINGSPQSEDCDKDNQESKDASKKRKTQPRWTDKVKVSSESMQEGHHDDGYSWRKYGQKDILGAKYPRSYYRCTFRNSKNCWATKQVQRSDEDPTIFDITYRGTHNCSPGSQAVPPPRVWTTRRWPLLSPSLQHHLGAQRMITLIFHLRNSITWQVSHHHLCLRQHLN